MTFDKHLYRESCMSQSAVYPINPPAAHRIADEAEALQVAEQVAAILLEQDAERGRTRQVPAEIVDLYSNGGLWGITVPREFGGAPSSSWWHGRTTSTTRACRN
jgi:alkylation response protein AidB-like acyl-CoA dehydrogenase